MGSAADEVSVGVEGRDIPRATGKDNVPLPIDLKQGIADFYTQKGDSFFDAVMASLLLQL
jgi:hypothetical protein